MPSQTPYVPISPTEIIEQTQEAFELGITIAHLHARDEQGKPTGDLRIYAQIIEGVRKHCPGLVVCASTSGRTYPEFEKRSAVIALRPDMCSLTLSSLNFFDQASMNSPEMIQKLAAKMKDFGVKAELECFDLGMINYGKFLIRKELVRPPFYWNFIFGNISGFQARTSHMKLASEEIQGDENFLAFGGIGRSQFTANRYAIENGFGVRVGIEDNLWFDDEKTVQASNIMLLKRVHEMRKEQGREFFTHTEFGKLGFYNADSFARV
jgi:uncharacterized protein (DUF849 family)